MRPQNWNLVRFTVQNDAQVVAALESSLVFTLRLGGASGNTYDNGFQNVVDIVIMHRTCIDLGQRALPSLSSALS